MDPVGQDARQYEKNFNRVRCRRCEGVMVVDEFIGHECTVVAHPDQNIHTDLSGSQWHQSDDWLDFPGGKLEREALHAGALFALARPVIGFPGEWVVQVLAANEEIVSAARTRIEKYLRDRRDGHLAHVMSMAPDTFQRSSIREPRTLLERIRALLFGTKFFEIKAYHLEPGRDLAQLPSGTGYSGPRMVR